MKKWQIELTSSCSSKAPKKTENDPKFLVALTGPLAYLGWKKYKEEQHDKMLEAGEKKEAAREEKEKQAQEKS